MTWGQGGGSSPTNIREDATSITGQRSKSPVIVGVLSDANLHFIVQTYPFARMKMRTIQYI